MNNRKLNIKKPYIQNSMVVECAGSVILCSMSFILGAISFVYFIITVKV